MRANSEAEHADPAAREDAGQVAWRPPFNRSHRNTGVDPRSCDRGTRIVRVPGWP